jgi:hypothetical protein
MACSPISRGITGICASERSSEVSNRRLPDIADRDGTVGREAGLRGAPREGPKCLAKLAVQSECVEIAGHRSFSRNKKLSKKALSSCRESVFEFDPGRVKQLRIEVLNKMKRLR